MHAVGALPVSARHSPRVMQAFTGACMLRVLSRECARNRGRHAPMLACVRRATPMHSVTAPCCALRFATHMLLAIDQVAQTSRLGILSTPP